LTTLSDESRLSHNNKRKRRQRRKMTPKPTPVNEGMMTILGRSQVQVATVPVAMAMIHMDFRKGTRFRQNSAIG